MAFSASQCSSGSKSPALGWDASKPVKHELRMLSLGHGDTVDGGNLIKSINIDDNHRIYISLIIIIMDIYIILYYGLMMDIWLVVLTIVKNMSSSMGRNIPYSVENKKWSKSPTSKSWDVYHLSTGAGFRTHPQQEWSKMIQVCGHGKVIKRCWSDLICARRHHL